MRKWDIKKDFANEALIIHGTQDCTNILKGNQIERDNPGFTEDLRFGRKVASVPQDILDHWITEGIDYRKINKDPQMKKAFFAKLNDPEWRALKTTPGHIG